MNGLNKPDVCVVIPTLNESGTIGVLIESLMKLRGLYDFRIVVVDDGSTDGTMETVQESSEKHGNIALIERGRKLGFGTAIRDGLEAALGLEPASAFIATMDADLSHDPCELPSLLEACERDSMVVGSRYVKGGEIHGWGLYRKVVSRGANFLARVLADIPVRDCTSGFRCYGADLVREVLPDLESVGYDIQIEIISRATRLGFEISERPITFRDRTTGESKLGSHDVWGFARRVFALRKVKK